jgi:flagellar protein FliO/FliZ
VDIAFAEYLRFLFALLFVLGLIGGLALLGKKFGFGNRGPSLRGAGKRLAIVETLALDAKRRLVLVRRDGAEHLILLGAAAEQVVEAVPRQARDEESQSPSKHDTPKALVLSLSKDGPAAGPHASTGSA